MKLSLATMADVTRGSLHLGDVTQEEKVRILARELHAAEIDSRAIRPDGGQLFVCLPGSRVDGHDYALAACEQGAQALLVQHVVPEVLERYPSVPQLQVQDGVQALGQIAAFLRARFSGTVIGVTGTAGKTTLRQWLAASLACGARVAHTEGNLNNQLGLPLSICRADGNEDYWVFELGISHARDMDELGAILQPDLAVILNAAQGHSEGLGDLGVAHYKARLLAHLADGAQPGHGAVVSGDYPDLVREARALVGPKSLSFFQVCPEDEASARLLEAQQDAPSACAWLQADDASRCQVQIACAGSMDGQYSFALPMAGGAGAENCACVALVLARLGLDPLLLQQGLANVAIPPHRNAHLPAGRHLVLDDTYNANPLSMERMLENACLLAQDRGQALACVLGCMGELGAEAPALHKALGRQLAAVAARQALAFVFWKGEHAAEVRQGLEEGLQEAGLQDGGGVVFAPFARDDELESLLATHLTADLIAQGLTVLCKGSRSNGLETAAALCQQILSQPAYQPDMQPGS